MHSPDRNSGDSTLLLDNTSRRRPAFIYAVAILAAVGGFLFGYDTGVVSGAMILLRDSFELDSIWQEVIVSVTILFAALFSFIAGPATERFGRKVVILLASFVFTVGAVLMGVAMNKIVLLIGRIVVGMGVGLASMTVPMYIGEVAPADIRGTLLTLNNCFITGGQFVASIICGAFSSDHVSGWRYMLGLAGVPSLIQFIGFLRMPDSPRWLISKGRYQDAHDVLKNIRGPNSNVEEELESIKANCMEVAREQAEKGGSSIILVQVFKNAAVFRALLIGCALQMFQQIAGINTVMYYSATIIEMTGVHDVSQAIWIASGTAALNFVCTFIGLFLVERVGRRLLTLGSLTGVILSLAILGVGFHLQETQKLKLAGADPYALGSQCEAYSYCSECVNDRSCGYCYFDVPGVFNGTCIPRNPDTNNPFNGTCTVYKNETIWAATWCPSNYGWIAVLGLFLYLFFFAPGMGPMPWTINSEIYPTWARSTCYSLSTLTNWVFNLLVSMTFLTLTEHITKHGTYYMYTGIALLGWIIFFVFLPETKGCPLEKVEELFSGPVLHLRKKSMKSFSDATADEKTAIGLHAKYSISNGTN